RRRQHFALADRGDAEVDFFADFGRDRRFLGFDFADDLRRVEGRRRVEAVLFRRFDQLVVADRRPERREDRVAGLGEGLAEGAAAVLAVGVVEEAAADVDPVGDFEFVVEADLVGLERRRSGDDLEGRAGRLGGGEGLAGEGADVAALCVQHRDAAGSPRQRRDRHFLQFGVDRRLHRRTLLRLALGEGADAGAVFGYRQQLAAGLAGEARVEGALEAADPDRRFRAEAVAGQVRPLFFGRFADFTGDVDRGAADRVFAFFGRAFGQRRAVAGEDRRPFGEFDVGGEFLARAQPREDEALVPFDAAVGVRDVEVFFDGAEGDGLDRHRDRDDLGGVG